MIIYLIRHSKTEGNVRRCYIGSTDEPLCQEGIKLLHEYSYPEVQEVIVSSMLRCIQTAKEIYPEHTLLSINDLRECDFGEFEEKNYEELKDNPNYQEWLSKDGKIPFPNGEDNLEFRKRCIRGFNEAVDYLIQHNITKSAMIIHGGTIMAILERYESSKAEFYHWKTENGMGYAIELDEDMWIKNIRNRTVTVLKTPVAKQREVMT